MYKQMEFDFDGKEEARKKVEEEFKNLWSPVVYYSCYNTTTTYTYSNVTSTSTASNETGWY